VDVEGEKLRLHQQRALHQPGLDGLSTHLDVTDLIVIMEPALSLKLQGQYMREGSLRKYLLDTFEHLLQRDDMDMATLVRARPILELIIHDRLMAARTKAYADAFQKQLDIDDGRVCVSLDQYTFNFPKDYPLGPRYAGSSVFDFHYYREIGDMNPEEVRCAEAIDRLEQVEHWARNIEGHPRHSFWLPTSSHKFYPDFVAELKDKRLFVVEYKGKHIKTSDETKEKEAVGKAWAKASGNLFLMAFERDKDGRDVEKQLRHCFD